ncbi:spherulin-2A [Helicoverpa armigera]|uniref:spherulin-2A n=1 Tax=Helicoverpa armigera TaxID=29058 RepID=UPI003083271C
MKTLLLLLTITVLTHSRIEVQITAADNKTGTILQVYGSNENIVNNRDIIYFNLTKECLKAAVNSYFGAKPEDVFLNNPTPFGDLYTDHKWNPVTKIIKPEKAQILDLSYFPFVINNELFNNTASAPTTAMTQIGVPLQEDVMSFWETPAEIFTEDIKYTFKVKSSSIPVKSSFSYISKMGENVLNSRSVFIGSETGMVVSLEPNQAVLVELVASKGTLKAKLDYKTILSGSVAVNYANRYKDHYIWSLDINKVLEAGGMNFTTVTSEVIDFTFYVNSKVNIRDFHSNVVLSTVPLLVF